jgi:LAO/AO transport system kinase
VLDHRSQLGDEGLTRKRAHQQLDFAWDLVRDELEERLRRSAEVRRVRDEVRDLVLRGDLPAVAAADRIVAAYDEAGAGGRVVSTGSTDGDDDAERDASVN